MAVGPRVPTFNDLGDVVRNQSWKTAQFRAENQPRNVGAAGRGSSVPQIEVLKGLSGLKEQLESLILEAVRLVDLKARMSNAGFVVGADQRELENRTILCGTQPRNLGCRWRGSILEAVHLGDLDDRVKARLERQLGRRRLSARTLRMRRFRFS
jgi:hypothetical protein